MTTDFQELTSMIVAFRDERNWKQFHNPKDLALALSIEAAELNEAFLWRKAEEGDRKKIAEELADVLVYALLLAHESGLDPKQIILDKMDVNAAKYPAEKSRDSARKYTEL